MRKMVSSPEGENPFHAVRASRPSRAILRLCSDMQHHFLPEKMASNVHCWKRGDRWLETVELNSPVVGSARLSWIMKTLLKLLVPLLVLLTQAFGQEPKTALIKEKPAAEHMEQSVTTGSAKAPAPEVQPKALPPLSPTLGEIARAARAAAAKAEMVLDPDADIITNPPEKTAAVTNETAAPGPRTMPRM